jgi:MFS family permease
MVTVMSNVAIITSIPLLKNHFPNVADMELYSRLMITLPSLSIALLAPFLGHLLQKVRRKISVVVGLLLFALFGSAGLYLESIETLLLSRALLGVAIAILMIVTTSLVGDYFSEKYRHKYMGLQSAFTAVGGIMFLIGGGALSDIYWRYPFGIYLIGVIFIPLVLLFLVEPEKHKPIVGEVEVNSSLLSIYFLAFILMLIFYILPTQMPFLIIENFGASGSLTGVIIAVAFVANAVGAMSFAKLKEHFSFGMIYLIGLIIIGVGFILISLVNDVRFFFFTSPIMGFGGGVLMTNVMAWMLSKSHHSKRVKSSGYITSALFLGQFASPLVFHPVVAAFGIQDFFAVVGVGLLSVVAVAMLFKKVFKITQ